MTKKDQQTIRQIVREELIAFHAAIPAPTKPEGKFRFSELGRELTLEEAKAVSYLESPRVYGKNKSGELLIGDGGKDVPSFTLRQDYFQARSAAQAAGLALMTEQEYRSFNDGSMEVETWTWLESGDAPSSALGGNWLGYVDVGQVDPRYQRDFLGARRVLRVKF